MKICPECNRAAANGIPKCRNKKCGHVYTNNYGFKDDKPTVRPDRKVDPKAAHRNENNRKVARLPKEEDGKLYISTFPKT